MNGAGARLKLITSGGSGVARLDAVAAARRGGRIDSMMLRHAVEQIDGLFAELVVIGLDASLAHSAVQLAETHGLRGYDAVHLATAVGLGTDSVLHATWGVDSARSTVAAGLSVSPQPREE